MTVSAACWILWAASIGVLAGLSGGVLIGLAAGRSAHRWGNISPSSNPSPLNR